MLLRIAGQEHGFDFDADVDYDRLSYEVRAYGTTLMLAMHSLPWWALLTTHQAGHKPKSAPQPHNAFVPLKCKPSLGIRGQDGAESRVLSCRSLLVCALMPLSLCVLHVVLLWLAGVQCAG